METKELKTRYELKGLLKAKATLLRELSEKIRKIQREGKYAGKEQSSLLQDKHIYRLMHIAYCLLRGRTYAQIENKVKEINIISERDWKFIKETQDEYSRIIEDVRISA